MGRSNLLSDVVLLIIAAGVIGVPVLTVLIFVSLMWLLKRYGYKVR